MIRTLADFIQRVEAVVRGVEGIHVVHDYPPDQLNAWPAVVAYAARGYQETRDYGLGPSFHDVAVEVHIPRKDLARDMATLLPLITTIPAALADDLELNPFYGAMARISYTLFQENYGGVETRGYRFVIEKVKL